MEPTMKRSSVLLTALLTGALLAAPMVASADGPIFATAGAGATYPPDTLFAGVRVDGLQSGFAVEINPDGSALGQFSAALLGISALGGEQDITIVGKATAGSPGQNSVVFSGAATIDMGDGLPPLEGVPFTATVTADGNGQGTIGLVIGQASLPVATVVAGMITIN
jgi:hypothetical protein